MSDLTKKILESGLIDETTAKIMERWGVLDEGSADLAKKAALNGATREQLIKFADDIGEEVDKQRRLRETMLDLNQLRWPVKVGLWNPKHGDSGTLKRLDAVIDRMGRYYFRPQDVELAWFVPGYVIMRGPHDEKKETILEVSELFVGDQVAAIQVSTQ